jgi:hypothetical protein
MLNYPVLKIRSENLSLRDKIMFEAKLVNFFRESGLSYFSD